MHITSTENASKEASSMHKVLEYATEQSRVASNVITDNTN